MVSLNEDLFDLLKINNLKETPKEVKPLDDSFCHSCNSYSLTNSKGQLIPTQCGDIKGLHIDNGAEWRYYGSEDSNLSDPNYFFMPTNSLLPEFFFRFCNTF